MLLFVLFFVFAVILWYSVICKIEKIFQFNLNTKKQSSKNLKTYNTPKKKLTKIKIISNKKNNRSMEEIKKYIKVQKLQVLLILK